jgi:hypothetical protein
MYSVPAFDQVEVTMTNEHAIAVSERYRTALADAAHWHRRQFRKGSQIPYLSHLLAVSAAVMEDGGSEDEAIAGLLHDAIEDAGVTEAVLTARYGPRIAAIVAACTDDRGGDPEHKAPWWPRKVSHIEHVTSAAGHGTDIGVLRVTAADKLSNLRLTLDEGDLSVFGRFKAGLGGFAWYQETFGQRLIAGLGTESLLARRIAEALEQLDAVVSTRRRSLGGALAAAEARLAAIDVPEGSGPFDPRSWFALDVANRADGGEPTAEQFAAAWASWFGTTVPAALSKPS